MRLRLRSCDILPFCLNIIPAMQSPELHVFFQGYFTQYEKKEKRFFLFSSAKNIPYL